jgi:hypothetical protein
MKEVFELVDQLQKHGYNVWFDEGIDPGTEWDEMIARHIQECSYFIGYITENYIDSQNCRDELNFARDLDKDRLMIYGEEVELPAGMQMRMNRLQAIFKYRYAYPEDFYEKLFNAYGIQTCKRKEPEIDTEEKTIPVINDDFDWSEVPTIVNKPQKITSEESAEKKINNIISEVIAANAQDVIETGDGKEAIVSEKKEKKQLSTADINSDLQENTGDPDAFDRESKIGIAVAAIAIALSLMLPYYFWMWY